MKIIDLLNKIANGEELPKKIKWRNEIYNLYEAESFINYKPESDGNWLLNQFLLKLNDEVEIIEEPKKIEKIDILEIGKNIKDNVKNDFYFAYKINEMIDRFNEVK